MDYRALIAKEREVWHDHFIPGLVAGIVVALITAFFSLTGSNVALFASIGASAVILSHKYRHRLTILRTAVVSYMLSGAISLGVAQLSAPQSIKVFLAIFAVTMVLYSANVFHPPAVSAGLAVVLYRRPLVELVYELGATMLLFVVIRFILYLSHEHLHLHEFIEEFT